MLATEKKIMKELKTKYDYSEVYLIKINYKSGLSEEFWFTKFEITTNRGEISEITYTPLLGSRRPISLGAGDIESVHLMMTEYVPTEMLHKPENNNDR